LSKTPTARHRKPVMFTLSRRTREKLEVVVPPGQRSAFVEQAIEKEIARLTRAEHKRRLAAAYRDRAAEDRQLNRQWSQLGIEVWRRAADAERKDR